MIDRNAVKRLQTKIIKARENEQLKEAMQACYDLAGYFSEYGKHEEALDTYEQALSFSKKLGIRSDIAIANRMMAETHCILGNYDKAIKYVHEYLYFAKLECNKIEGQRAFATKGRIYFCWAEYLLSGNNSFNFKKGNIFLEKSLKAYKKSLELCEKELNNIERKEKLEMKSRIFQNLALVKGLMGHYTEANNYLTIAIQINKTEKFKSNLYWCYLNQGELFLKANDVKNGLVYFNLALKASVTTKNKIESLKSKAKAYFSVGDYSKAKATLRDAYRINSGKNSDVVQKLKIAVLLCNIEKKLSSTKEDDYSARKKLYESLGDVCCTIKNYKQAIVAYLDMLVNAKKNGESGRELCPCYTSLSQTYKDDKQYDLALKYCQEELELVKDSPSEASKSYLCLGELYELLDYDYELIYKTYQQSRKLAEEINDVEQQIMALTSIINLQKGIGYNKLANQHIEMLKILKRENNINSDDDSETEIIRETFSVGIDSFDINDDELFSDSEDDKIKQRSKRSLYRINRNKKGETDLHIAAIMGNYRKAKLLIDQGHPVDEPDLAGWSPLHEACNHGHISIVNLLLDSGADINNPGGSKCRGFTPLHDAAENGHLDVIDLLIKKGASTAVLTNNGFTPLDCLKHWRKRSDLSDKDLVTYRKIRDILRSNLDSADLKKERLQMTSDLATRHNLKLKANDGIDEKLSTHNDINLRKRPYDMNIKKSDSTYKLSKPSAIPVITESSTGIQDVNLQVDKEAAEGSIPLIKEENFEYDWPDWPEWQNIEQLMPEQLSSENDDSPNAKSNGSVALLDKTMKTEIKKLQEELPKTEYVRFKVHILDKKFIISIDKMMIETLKVEWLTEKVSKWYEKMYGQRVDLSILLNDALQRKNSSLSVLLNGERNIYTKVNSCRDLTLRDLYMNEWELLEEEYKCRPHFCSFTTMSKALKKKIITALEFCETENNLNLNGFSITCCAFTPIFKALEVRKTELKILDLSQNVLNDEGIVQLVNCLRTCFCEELLLASNNITIKGIQHFSLSLQTIPLENLKKIKVLDLRFNPLKDISIPFLNNIADYLKNLQIFDISFCDLTKSLKKNFQPMYTKL